MFNFEEPDYRPAAVALAEARYLPGTRIEIVHELELAAPPEHVLFDFDGTLSLIREGWPEVMVPLMVEVLQGTGTPESTDTLHKIAFDFVMELTGKQTIYQMIRLADEVTKRGGAPQEPSVYKQMYHDRLMERISSRRENLRLGRIPPEDMVVPGSIDLLRALAAKGLKLYLASGTDEQYVQEEVALLGLEEYFNDHVYGAVEDYKTFSKAHVIQRILDVNNVDGSRLLGFGDGYVEIQNVKAVNGVAVAVASDETNRSGQPDAWKRTRLINVGADIVIPDYREFQQVIDYVWR
jgi:phosphoglycolate phosphatase-like HAD superfamily hydrolase